MNITADVLDSLIESALEHGIENAADRPWHEAGTFSFKNDAGKQMVVTCPNCHYKFGDSPTKPTEKNEFILCNGEIVEYIENIENIGIEIPCAAFVGVCPGCTHIIYVRGY